MGVKIQISKKQFNIVTKGKKTRLEVNHAGREAGLDVCTRLKRRKSKKVSVKKKGAL